MNSTVEQHSQSGKQDDEDELYQVPSDNIDQPLSGLGSYDARKSAYQSYSCLVAERKRQFAFYYPLKVFRNLFLNLGCIYLLISSGILFFCHFTIDTQKDHIERSIFYLDDSHNNYWYDEWYVVEASILLVLAVASAFLKTHQDYLCYSEPVTVQDYQLAAVSSMPMMQLDGPFVHQHPTTHISSTFPYTITKKQQIVPVPRPAARVHLPAPPCLSQIRQVRDGCTLSLPSNSLVRGDLVLLDSHKPSECDVLVMSTKGNTRIPLFCANREDIMEYLIREGTTSNLGLTTQEFKLFQYTLTGCVPKSSSALYTNIYHPENQYSKERLCACDACTQKSQDYIHMYGTKDHIAPVLSLECPLFDAIVPFATIFQRPSGLHAITWNTQHPQLKKDGDGYLLPLGFHVSFQKYMPYVLRRNVCNVVCSTLIEHATKIVYNRVRVTNQSMHISAGMYSIGTQECTTNKMFLILNPPMLSQMSLILSRQKVHPGCDSSMQRSELVKPLLPQKEDQGMANGLFIDQNSDRDAYHQLTALGCEQRCVSKQEDLPSYVCEEQNVMEQSQQNWCWCRDKPSIVSRGTFFIDYFLVSKTAHLGEQVEQSTAPPRGFRVVCNRIQAIISSSLGI